MDHTESPTNSTGSRSGIFELLPTLNTPTTQTTAMVSPQQGALFPPPPPSSSFAQHHPPQAVSPSLNSSVTSAAGGGTTTRKKRPPSLFGSFAGPPSQVSPQMRGGDQSMTSCPLHVVAHTPLTLPSQGGALTDAAVAHGVLPAATVMVTAGCSGTSPPMPPISSSSSSQPIVALTEDRRTLLVGPYVVSREGCLTIRNHLLLNSSTHHHHPSASSSHYHLSSLRTPAGERRLPDPTATPPLKSTHMEEPLSPITYSMDCLPAVSGLPPSTESAFAAAAAQQENEDGSVVPYCTAPPPVRPPSSCGVSPAGGGGGPNHHVSNESIASSSKPDGELPNNASFATDVVSVEGDAASGGQPHQEEDRTPELRCRHPPPPPTQGPHLSSNNQQQQQLLLQRQHSGMGMMGSPLSSVSPRGGNLMLRYTDITVLDPFEAGASASVHRAIHRETGKLLAVKRIDLSPLFPHVMSTTSSCGSALSGPLSPQLRGLLLSGTVSPPPPPPPPPPVTMLHSIVNQHPSQSAIPAVVGNLIPAAAYLPKHRQMLSILQRELQVLHSEYRSAHVVKMYNAFYNSDLCCLDIVMEFMEYGCLARIGRTQATSSTMTTTTAGRSVSSPVATERSSSLSSSCCTPSATAGGAGGLNQTTTTTSSSTIASVDSPCLQPASTLRKRRPLSERVLAIVAEQVLRGVEDMHNRGHVHRDIKPDNILVNLQGVVKLSDFGLCESVRRTSLPPATTSTTTDVNCSSSGSTNHLKMVSTPCGLFSNLQSQNRVPDVEEVPLCSGTDRYMSPERHRGEPHGKASDIWSLGVTLAECALAAYPVPLQDCTDEFERVDRITRMGDWLAAQHKGTLSPLLIDFLQQCLQPRPEERPSATQLQSHQFLSQWSDSFDFAQCVTNMQREPSSEEGGSMTTAATGSANLHEARTNTQPYSVDGIHSPFPSASSPQQQQWQAADGVVTMTTPQETPNSSCSQHNPNNGGGSVAATVYDLSSLDLLRSEANRIQIKRTTTIATTDTAA